MRWWLWWWKRAQEGPDGFQEFQNFQLLRWWPSVPDHERPVRQVRLLSRRIQVARSDVELAHDSCLPVTSLQIPNRLPWMGRFHPSHKDMVPLFDVEKEQLVASGWRAEVCLAGESVRFKLKS